VAQEAGLSVNLRSDAGLEAGADVVVPLDPDRVFSSPESVRDFVEQLYVRISPAEGVSISGGKQRLNWGTAKIFAAIDTLEVRANPLDVRPVLVGVPCIKAEIIPGDLFGFSLVLMPASELRWSRVAARMDYTAESIGLDLGIGAVKDTFLDRNVVPGSDPEKLDRVALVSDGAWSSGPLVLYEEGQLRWGRESGYWFPGMTGFNDLAGRDQAVFRGVGGTMLQIDLGLTRPATLIAEYLYNGDGLTGDEARAFAASYVSWKIAGAPDGAELPAALMGIGDFRRHSVAVALQNVALSRDLLASATAILGIDSLFGRFAGALQWNLSQETSLVLSYEYFTAFSSAADQPTEMLLIPFKNRITVSFTTSYQ
jgi:hypothetical protein